MPLSKLEYYRELAFYAEQKLTISTEEWTNFLTTVSRVYKYPYHEQLLIHAQRPDTRACAPYDVWNRKMGRYIRRGAKGIALLDDSGGKPRIRYVFDLSDTVAMNEQSRTPWLWELEEKHMVPVTAMLERTYGIGGNAFEQQITDIARKLSDSYWSDHQEDLLRILDDSFLEEYDEFNIGVRFKTAATVSIAYAIMLRCGLEPELYFDHQDFVAIFDFNTPATIEALGSAVSQINQQVLRQIGDAIRKADREAVQERRKLNERHREKQLGGQAGVRPERGVLDSEVEVERPGGHASGQVRQDAESIPEGTSAHHLQPHAAPRDPVPPSEGDRPDGQREAGADDAGAGEGSGSHGRAESQRPDEVGRPDEHLQSPGRGGSEDGADLQLTLSPIQEEQNHRIDEAENAKASSALSFAPDDGDSQQEKPLPIPFVEGYAALKAQYYDAVVGVEVGEYVIFLGEDAQTAAKAMGTKILSVDIPGMGMTDMTGSNLGWTSVLRRLMEQNLSIVLAQQDPEGGPEAPYEIIKERYAGEYDLRTDEEYAQEELTPGETTLVMDGRTFQVSKLELDIGRVELRDVTFAQATGFPIFRVEPISVVRAYLEQEPVKAPEKSLEETLDEYPISVELNRQWHTFPNAAAAEKYKANLQDNAQNFRITDDNLGTGGQKEKFWRNIKAIATLKQMEQEHRNATLEEQHLLSQYVGWGGLADAFDPHKEGWSVEYEQLKELLTPEEYTAARGSTLNAHYTSPVVIRAMYDAVGRMGFETGNILEPSCGVGNFFGILPERMAGSKLYGVELDSISGRIAQQLYPRAEIAVNTPL